MITHPTQARPLTARTPILTLSKQLTTDMQRRIPSLGQPFWTVDVLMVIWIGGIKEN